MDLKYEMMLDEFKGKIALFEKMREIVLGKIEDFIKQKGFLIEALESRVKAPQSLEGKLIKKGYKYKTLLDITDLVGVRVVTYYLNDINAIADMVQNIFTVDWANSVDKGKLLNPDQFGYRSLHYICSIPKSLYFDPEHPEINTFRFEVQMRTALQHIWSAIQHDTGYKTTFDIPVEYSRSLNGLAGLFELVDKEFETLRNQLDEYRENIKKIIQEKRYNEISINVDSFKLYQEYAKPFDALNTRIAKINNMEIHEANMDPYRKMFQALGFKNLSDIEKLIEDYSEAAYKLAEAQLKGMDIDIISSTVGVRNLCIAFLYNQKHSIDAMEWFEETLNGKRESNHAMAELLMKNAAQVLG